MEYFARIFQPITFKPKGTKTNAELLPCEALRPYIRCFWGAPGLGRPIAQPTAPTDPSLVIPDTCMDIVCRIDYGTNKVHSYFSGINDAPFYDADSQKTGSIFGIRFYLWSVYLFADQSMEKALNALVDVEEYFNDFKKKLGDLLIEKTTLRERVAEVEKYLIHRLKLPRHLDHNVMNAIAAILKSKGLITVSDLCQSAGASQRHLERQFLHYFGTTPKKTVDLVRFQNVWQQMVYSRTIDLQDMVYRYGYYDQAHFNKDFKKYYGSTPLVALEMSGFYNTTPEKNGKL